MWRRLRGRGEEPAAEKPDPTSEVDRALRETAAEIARFRQDLASSLLDERKLERDVRMAATQEGAAARRAEQAMQDGDEPLARSAMAEKMQSAREGAEARARLAAHGKVVSELRESLRLLAMRLDDATRRRNALLARQQGAQARQKLAESLGGAGSTDSFGNWEDKVRSLERDAHVALDILSDLGTGESEDDRTYREAADAARLEASMRDLRNRLGRTSEGGSGE